MHGSKQPAQLPLALHLNEGLSFDNFVSGANQELYQLLRQGNAAEFIYIWGAAGAGKSHLLQALCQQCTPVSPALYLPLKLMKDLGPQVLDGCEHYALVAIDGPSVVASQPQWEESLFHLYNRVKAAGGSIVVADQAPPDQIGVQLADLRSRLQWGPVFQLHSLQDPEKVEALTLRAAESGLELSKEVANYLLRYTSRDPHQLFANLERLDNAALIQKRRLTIPFVRQVLGLVDSDSVDR